MTSPYSLDTDRAVLYAALNTGKWHFSKCSPQPYFTEEFNAELATEWIVERSAPPYCLNRGAPCRVWSGNGPAAALESAFRMLAEEGFQLEPEVLACFPSSQFAAPANSVV